MLYVAASVVPVAGIEMVLSRFVFHQAVDWGGFGSTIVMAGVLAGIAVFGERGRRAGVAASAVSPSGPGR